MDEEQTVSGKSAGETTGIPEKREAQEAAPEETVQVYICGAVASPGVYTLPGGSRVVQAVEAAGGFLPDAEEKILNLARKIEDGEQITVWTREEAENMEITETPQQNTGGTEQASGSGKVNLNTAGKEELMTLSGIGESRADAIIAYREANGPFGSIEEIMNIEGIKGKMFEKIRGSIEV
ncbi:helix-hairpin-helix domain-containing protein [Fusicatenibacter saccharivorans]